MLVEGGRLGRVESFKLTFILLDRHHWQRVDDFVEAEWGLELQAHDVLANQVGQDIDDAVLLGELLERHVSRGPSSANKILLVDSLEQNVLHSRLDPAVGLTIHGLRTQSCCHEVDGLVAEWPTNTQCP